MTLPVGSSDGAVLYLSPHADDVAFSAAGQLARDVAAGREVTLLTLFAPPPDGPGGATPAARRGEDEAFARAFGVELADGGWLDAVARRARYRRPTRLFAPLDGDEAPLVEAVRARLQQRVDGGARRVVAPLGVGGHVDHQIVHAAARQLTGAVVEYYEDTPYVLTPYQLPRRLARLGVAPAAVTAGDGTLARGSVTAELAAAARSWLGAPLMRQAVAPPLRGLAVAAILTPEWTRWPRRSRAATGALAAAVLATAELAQLKRRAIACYRSQWPLFYASLDGFMAALDAYGRALGADGVVERSWRAP